MPPQFIRTAMVEAMDAGHNQYSRSLGVPVLVNKIAEVYGAKLGRPIDAMKEVLVTLGANGALAAFTCAYCNQGD